MSDKHNLTAFELYAALSEHAKAFHAGFTAGVEYGRQERSRPLAFAPGGVHGSPLNYRCPRCGQMAVNIVNLPLPGGSTATCMEGHEWNPFATSGARPGGPFPPDTPDVHWRPASDCNTPCRCMETGCEGFCHTAHLPR